MTKNMWRPLSVRNNGKEALHDALVEGVPSWLKPVLARWLNEALLTEDDYMGGRSVSRVGLEAVQVHLRIDGLEWRYGEEAARDSVLAKCFADGDLFLSAIDYALHVLGPDGLRVDDSQRLEGFLLAGGSAWAVSPDRRALVRRVTAEAQASAAAAVGRGDRAGELLGLAWNHAFGRNPQPGLAYREAVRATEAALCPIILPNDQMATLGKAIAALRDAPQGKFVTVFVEERAVDPLEVVRNLMSLLWTNQLDRHGNADVNAPLHVTGDQAEAALHAALVLVQWAQRGVLTNCAAGRSR